MTAARGARDGPLDTSGQLRLAYLVSRYPLPTHAFIAREVDALRRLGAEVHMFGLHPVTATAPRSGRAGETGDDTFCVRTLSARRLASAHVRGLLRHPRAYLAALGLRLPSGRHGRLTQLFYFAEAVPIWRETRRRGLSHIHAHFTNPAADVAMLVAALGARAGGCRTWSFTAHGTDMLDDLRERLAEKVRRASFVVCVSETGRSLLMRLVDDEHWDRIHVVRCGLEPRWFESSTPERSPNGALRLLTVGRLVPEKGHAILLEALASLRRRGLPVHLEVVGNGARLASLRRRAARLGVEDLVRFTGEVVPEAIRERYDAADAFCLPSISEGLPVVLMEAMASELPVIATRLMGIPELVEDGVTGMLVTPGRPEALAGAIERLAASPPEQRRRLGAAARARVEEQFGTEAAARTLLDAFAATVNGPAPRTTD